MMDWQRRRHPEDVPTPVAVAVADFCRRAKGPSSPAAIRDALSLLTDDDDFRVQKLADSEPTSRPLGPFAVVDVICGTEQSVAAQREETGYYTLVKQLAEERTRNNPPPPRPAPSAPRAKEKPARTEAEERSDDRKEAKARRGQRKIQEKIAPRRRKAGEERPAPPPPRPPASSYLPKHAVPQPRGRFTRVDSTRSPLDALLKVSAKLELEALLDNSPTRISLRRALEPGYSGRKGAPLTTEDVEGVLTRHELLSRMQKKEREVILTAATDAQGALGRTARELNMTNDELDRLIELLKLRRDLDEMRDRFAREALSPRNLGHRLTLVNRTKYLVDLGIEKRFMEALERDLVQVLDALDGDRSLDDLVDLAAKEHALHAEAIHRAVEKLGLTKRYSL